MRDLEVITSIRTREVLFAEREIVFHVEAAAAAMDSWSLVTFVCGKMWGDSLKSYF